MQEQELDIARQIDAAALDLLMDPGIKLDHEAICRLLIKAGAKPGHAADIIRFPKELVREKLQALLPTEEEITIDIDIKKIILSESKPVKNPNRSIGPDWLSDQTSCMDSL